MKNYVIFATLVLGLFGGISPTFGEITIGDNVAFLNFSAGDESGLDVGTVLTISDDGDWFLIYVQPNDLMAVSKWFIYSDETIADQLLTNLLSSTETPESVGPTEPTTPTPTVPPSPPSSESGTPGGSGTGGPGGTHG